MKRKSLYRMIGFLEFCIFFLILLFEKSSGADPQYEACVRRSCEKGPSMRFPFYIDNMQEAFCGLFRVSCGNSGYPIFRMAENDYVIEQIVYESHSFRVYNAALDNLAENCLSGIRNVTPPTPSMSVVSESRLHLFSRCRTSLSEQLEKYRVACDNETRDGWELAVLENDDNLNSAIQECETNVLVPVELLRDEGRNGVPDYERLLRRGFNLNWKTRNCTVCEESGGRCGIDTGTNGVRCFCSYGTEYAICKSSASQTRFFSRGLGFLLSFLVLFHLLPCLSAQEYDSFNSSCPMGFQCRNLSRMEFPFANFSRPDCGLFMVDCSAHPLPTVKLCPTSGHLFHAKGRLQSNIIKLHDPTLEKILGQNSSCYPFLYNLFLPNSPSISFAIKFNIILFKCMRDPPLSPEVIDHFHKNKYRKYESCPMFAVYFKNPENYVYDKESELPSPGCSSLHLPMHPRKNISEDTELLRLLTADFDLEWDLSDKCYRDCHLKGGQCQTDEMSEFLCANAREGRNKLTIILATAIPGGVLLGIALAFFLVRKKGIKDHFHFLSRSISKTYSKHDLEGGSVYFGVPVFSYAELEDVTNKFDASKELGDGGFGTVYYGKLRDGREVAVKRLYEHNFKRMAQFMNEVEILTRLRHPNLVSLYGCTSRRSRELLLVYEYIPNGTVADHLHGDRAKDKLLTWPVRMSIAMETSNALAYLHASDIIHRDVKTNNILLDHNFQVKVADFGLSRLLPNDVSHVSTAPQGTPGYVDPEYHQCYQLTDKSDVYSFGVVLIELISSMPAVDISRHRQEINLSNLAINRIQRHAFSELIDPSLGYELDPEVMRMTTSVAELAFRCLQLEKEIRPTMDEVLETLKAIQDWNKDSVEKADETNGNTVESIGRMNHASPESDDVVLLKNKRFPSSPNSVTDIWASGSTSTTTSSR